MLGTWEPRPGATQTQMPGVYCGPSSFGWDQTIVHERVYQHGFRGTYIVPLYQADAIATHHGGDPYGPALGAAISQFD
jgi:hypothetical protein